MRSLFAVAVLAVLAGCASEGPTGPDPVVIAASPTPTAQAAAPDPVPSPETKPAEWSAEVTDQGWLVHRNFTSRWQHVTACAYHNDQLITENVKPEGRDANAPPEGKAELWPLDLDSWDWPPLSERVVIVGLLGSRTCTPTTLGLGAGGPVTVYREIPWPPTGRTCLRKSCS